MTNAEQITMGDARPEDFLYSIAGIPLGQVTRVDGNTLYCGGTKYSRLSNTPLLRIPV